jgi:Flp pilus assembly protein TadB
MRAYIEEDPSLGELISRLTEQTSHLVRDEVELAKTELTQSAKRAGKGAGLMVAGAALGYAGLLAVIATCIILLALVVKLWIAALVISGLVIGAALLLIMLGLNTMKRESLAPKYTLETVKEDVEWAKAQTR